MERVQANGIRNNRSSILDISLPNTIDMDGIGKMTPQEIAEEQARISGYFGRPNPNKKKQSPANALTDAVITYIKLKGGIAYRINNMGVYDAKLGKFRTSGTKKGIPDIIGIHKGRFIGVEIKIGKDRQSDDQKLREQEIIKAGGYYYIAKEFDSFKIWYDGTT